MTRDFCLLIPKGTLPQWLLFCLLAFPLLQALLPEGANFVCDGCLMGLIGVTLLAPGLRVEGFLRFLLGILGGLTVYSLAVYLLRYQSVFYYLWGYRNQYRFFLAFLAFALWLPWEAARRWSRWLGRVYWLHILLTLGQFALGFRQDHLGGLFGVRRGCNGGVLILLSIQVTRTLVGYLRGERSGFSMAMVCASALLNAALSELKGFFVMFGLIFLISAGMNRPSRRKILLLGVSILGVAVFSALLGSLYGEFEDFLSPAKLWEALANPAYSQSRDLGRFTAIPRLREAFLSTLPEALVGLGLGNCQKSSLAFLNTPFARAREGLHYSYFTYAQLFLETGYVGLLLYGAFFGAIFAMGVTFPARRVGDGASCQSAAVLSLVGGILTVYNNSLETEAAFLLAFFLALPFVSLRGRPSGGKL